MTPEELNVFAYPEGPAAPQITLDATGQTIFAISSSGLTVMELPQPIDNLPSSPWAMARQGAGQLHDFANVSSRIKMMRKKLLKLKSQ
jgi:hypothetical protein